MTALKAANRFKGVSEALDAALANLSRYRLDDGTFFDPSTLPQVEQIRNLIASATDTLSKGPNLTRARTEKVIEVGMKVDVTGASGVWEVTFVGDKGAIHLIGADGTKMMATKSFITEHDDSKPAPADDKPAAEASAKRGPGRPAAAARKAPPRPNA